MSCTSLLSGALRPRRPRTETASFPALKVLADPSYGHFLARLAGVTAAQVRRGLERPRISCHGMAVPFLVPPRSGKTRHRNTWRGCRKATVGFRAHPDLLGGPGKPNLRLLRREGRGAPKGYVFYKLGLTRYGGHGLSSSLRVEKKKGHPGQGGSSGCPIGDGTLATRDEARMTDTILARRCETSRRLPPLAAYRARRGGVLLALR